jgi:hypothetical protein
VLVDILAASADWVASSAVSAKDRRVAVQTSKFCSVARSRSLVGTVKNVVGLVGSMPNVTPEKSGGNWMELVWRVISGGNDMLTSFASLGGRVKARGDECASTGST